MVDNIHHLSRLRIIAPHTLWPVYLTAPKRFGGGNAVRCFPEVYIFAQDIRHESGIGERIHENDEASVVFDERLQRRPCIHPFRGVRGQRRVCVRRDTTPTRIERFLESMDRHTIRVREQDGHDLPRMLIHPILYDTQISLEWAGIFQSAVGMACAQSPTRISPRLHLEKTHASVELCGDGDVLVVGGKDTDEGGAVGAYLGDVAVGARAEGGVAVAAVWERGWGEGGKGGVVEGEEGFECVG